MTMFGLSVKLISFAEQAQWLLFSLALALMFIGVAVSITTIGVIRKSPNS
jgi:hypothetical protein